MRAEYPIFPLLFLLVVILSIVTVFVSIGSLSNEIGDNFAGIRSSTALNLFQKTEEAERFLETTVRLAMRESVAEAFRKNRYPCEVRGSFIAFDDSCGTVDSDRFDERLRTRTERRANAQIATYPGALIPPLESLTFLNLGGVLAADARLSGPAVFFLDETDWRNLDRSPGVFDRDLAPVHTEQLYARAYIQDIISPIREEHHNFDRDEAMTLVEESREADRTYCEDDPFKEIVVTDRLVDLIESCPSSEDACSCGTINVPESGYSLRLVGSSVYLSNRVYSLERAVSHPLEESDVSFDDSTYMVLMNRSEISLIDPSEHESIPVCRISDPKINVFSTMPFFFETDVIERDGSQVLSSDIFADNKENIALYDYSISYATWLGQLFGMQAFDGGGVIPSTIEERIVSSSGMNVVITTHVDDGSSLRFSGSEPSGVPMLAGSFIEQNDLYPRPESRLESITNELGYFDIDEAITICRLRRDDLRFLKDAPRTEASMPIEEAFFQTIVDSGAPYLFVSVPQSFVDECLDERSIDFIQPNEFARTVQERVFSSIIEAVIIHLNAPTSGRLLCLDDPVQRFTHHPFLGYGVYELYPSVIVPETNNFVWPLQDIGSFTQCWGPPALSWEDPPYTYHRGLDLQPSGRRIDQGTVWDRFDEVPVVAAFSGNVVYASECPWSPYFDPPGYEGAISREDLMFAASEDCTGRDAPFSGAGFGEHLVIESSDGDLLAIYAHLAPGSIWKFLGEPRNRPVPRSGSFETYEGIPVVAGEPIGFVGNTGTSTGAHLHFEIYPNDGSRMNPSTKRPLWPSGGYTPSAKDYLQFNPFCVLPQEVELPDGSTYDISERMPRIGGFDTTDPVTAAIEETVSESGTDFNHPRNQAEMCFYNYVMAYYGRNFYPETYGVCP